MTEEIKRQLWEWAAAYHCAGFIQNDPYSFHIAMNGSRILKSVAADCHHEFRQP